MQPPAPAPAPTDAPGRPASVSSASILLILMAVAGLAYAVATLVIAPGTVDRFRAAAGGASSADVDGFITVVWIGAALGAVLAVILFALYVVLALGLRRGSNAARIATWVVAGLGLLAGCASTATVAVQRSGDPGQGSLSAALSDAYPGSWIPLNVSLAIAQMLGYVLVGVLLLASPGTFFGRAPKPLPPDPFAAPGHGAPGSYPAMPGYPSAPGQGTSSGYPAAPGYPSATDQGASGGFPAASSYPAAPGGYPPAPGGYPAAAQQQGAPGGYPEAQQGAPGGYPGASQPGAPGGYPTAPGQPAPGGYGPPPTGGYGMPPTGGSGSSHPAPGSPPVTPEGTTPAGSPPAHPDDEYWSRPSS
jgi:hypothetical protein